MACLMVWMGCRRPKVAEDLDEVFAQILAAILALFHLESEAQQIRDGLLRIIDDGVQEPMVESNPSLFRRA